MNEKLSAEDKTHLSIQSVLNKELHVVQRYLIGKMSLSAWVRGQIHDFYLEIIAKETK